jgi:hypothetical protein
VSAASEALRSASLSLRDAARKEGIMPHDPMWLWSISQEAALDALATLAEEQEKNSGVLIRDTKVVVDSQVTALKTTLQVAQEQNKRSEIMVRQSESDREKLVNHTVDQLTEQVSAKLSGALVLRQRRYDRTHRWGSAALVAGIALGVFLGGYSLHAYQWRFETGGVQRCLQSAVRSADGTLFCQVKAVQAAW